MVIAESSERTNMRIFQSYSFFKNGPTQASFLFIFNHFKQTIQFLQQINVKKCLNVHLVYDARIRTHNLQNMSCHP